MNTMNLRHRVEAVPLPPVDDGIPNFQRLWLAFTRHAALLGFAALTGLGLALGFLLLAGPSWQAHAMILMRRPAPLAAGLPEGPGAIPDAELRNELEVIRSRELGAVVLGRLAPGDLPGDAGEETLRARMAVSRLDGSYIFIIAALGTGPEAAARIANAYANAYVARREAAIAAAETERRRTLESRVAASRAAVAARQAELLAAARAPGDFEQAMLRRSELEHLLESDRGAHAEALALLRGTGRAADPNQLTATVMSPAVPPAEPGGPKPFMILTLGAVLGLACGGAVAIARENLDDTLRTGDQVRRALGQPFLGYLPRLPGTMTRTGAPKHPVWRAAAEHPRCRYAETLRFIRARAEPARAAGSALVLGIGSARAGEGKSLAAANLAFLFAAEGRRVLVIDVDLRGAGLGVTFGRGDDRALAAALDDPDAIGAARDDGPDFIPARDPETGAAPLYVEGGRLDRALASWRARYDIIILDLPALAEAACTRGLIPALDGWVVVARWGVTPGHALGAILREEPALATNLLGVVLSDLKPDRLRRYTPHAGAADEA